MKLQPHIKNSRSKQCKRSIYKYDQMTKDSWEEFSNTTTGMLDKKKLKQPITNEADLNRH